MTDAERRKIARLATRKERARCAAICVLLAGMMEAGAGENAPGGRLRQAARMIREGAQFWRLRDEPPAKAQRNGARPETRPTGPRPPGRSRRLLWPRKGQQRASRRHSPRPCDRCQHVHQERHHRHPAAGGLQLRGQDEIGR